MLNLCEDYGNYFSFKSFRHTFAVENETAKMNFYQNTPIKNER